MPYMCILLTKSTTTLKEFIPDFLETLALQLLKQNIESRIKN